LIFAVSEEYVFWAIERRGTNREGCLLGMHGQSKGSQIRVIYLSSLSNKSDCYK